MTLLGAIAPIRLDIDAAVAQRLEAAYAVRATLYAEAVALLRPELGVTTIPVAGGVAVFAGPAAPVNRAFGLALQRAVTGGDIDRIEDFFSARGESPRFDLCPLADPSLSELLRGRGYGLERFWSVLVRPLTYQDQDTDCSALIEVNRVSSGQEQLWLRTVAQGITGQDNPDGEALERVNLSLRSPGMIPFLAWIDGEPAGGAGILIHDGIAECFSAGTRPAFRRRGVQAALLQARIAAAAQAGCQLTTAMIQPGTSSERNAQRAGFQLAYSKTIMVGRVPDWI